MVELFQKGGPFMWPLLFVAIAGIAFVIERFISFAMASINGKRFSEGLKNTLSKKGVEGGLEYCRSYRAPLARAIEAGLITYQKVGPNKDALEEAIINAGNVELAFLERGLPILSAVSTVAPILGFLGTVSGMISAFDAVAIAGEIEPTLVASGISEALITTATGLAIAFPIVLFHVFFTTRANGYTRMMENSAASIVEYLLERTP
ncbi:MotA/TolQ/ExbB proton channel family protein [candidate division WOR-3 bacterium]|nr:MotA/TolQ/ExbB proton channel family protein [candidate division WOR-3 bacterium]